MQETYTTAAHTILRDAIRSILLIDDELALPFDTAATQEQKILSSSLYQSFTNQNRGLDFYRYQPSENWELKKDYFFKGRDLLVLDWQLDSDYEQHRNTLKILQEAVNQPSTLTK